LLRPISLSTRPARLALVASVSVHAGLAAGIGWLAFAGAGARHAPHPHIDFGARVEAPQLRVRPRPQSVAPETPEPQLIPVPEELAADAGPLSRLADPPARLDRGWLFRVPVARDPQPEPVAAAAPLEAPLPVLVPAAASTRSAPVFRPAQVRADASPEPEYPRAARRRGWQGLVRVRVHVSPAGRVVGVSLEESSGHQVLDAAALEAVRAWRFDPASRDDMVVADDLVVPVRFRIVVPRH